MQFLAHLVSNLIKAGMGSYCLRDLQLNDGSPLGDFIFTQVSKFLSQFDQL